MKKISFFILLSVFTSTHLWAAPQNIQIVREDSENPFVSIAKSTFYGATLGSIISFAIMLATNGDDSTIFKVSFISGTGLGLGYGIYHVATRDSHATIQISDKGTSLGIPQVQLKNKQKETQALVNVLAWSF